MRKLKALLPLAIVVLLGGASIGTAASPAAPAAVGTQAALPPASSPAVGGVAQPGLGTNSAPVAHPVSVPGRGPGCVAHPGTVPCLPPCRVITENPTGLCPPITAPPAPGHPAIVFCPTAPVALQPAPGTIQLHGFVCGRGFHPNEAVTLTATGARGTFSWHLQASSSGSFVSPLPPLLCRFAPLTLTATGSTGDRSNSLFLSATSCLPSL